MTVDLLWVGDSLTFLAGQTVKISQYLGNGKHGLVCPGDGEKERERKKRKSRKETAGELKLARYLFSLLNFYTLGIDEISNYPCFVYSIVIVYNCLCC